jgi:adenylate kinase family enzyme
MKLIIINGTTSTGKSTLAGKLAKDLGIKAYLRDVYKEQEFDLLGKSPSLKQLSIIETASQQKLFEAIEGAVKQDESLIVESNFTYAQAKKIKSLIRPNTVVVEIFCFANGFRIFKRYVGRNKSGERHHGHRDYLWYPIVAVEAFGIGKLRYRPLKLSPNTLLVDTNNFATVDYGKIRKFIVEVNK